MSTDLETTAKMSEETQHQIFSLIVQETIYHITPDGAESLAANSNRKLASDEQMYQRRCTATDKWEQLDTGWVKDIALLHVENKEGRFLINPSEEEREDSDKRVLEISYCPEVVGGWLIPPRETFRGTPSGSTLYIRCKHGEAKYLVSAIPS